MRAVRSARRLTPGRRRVPRMAVRGRAGTRAMVDSAARSASSSTTTPRVCGGQAKGLRRPSWWLARGMGTQGAGHNAKWTGSGSGGRRRKGDRHPNDPKPMPGYRPRQGNIPLRFQWKHHLPRLVRGDRLLEAEEWFEAWRTELRRHALRTREKQRRHFLADQEGYLQARPNQVKALERLMGKQVTAMEVAKLFSRPLPTDHTQLLCRDLLGELDSALYIPWGELAKAYGLLLEGYVHARYVEQADALYWQMTTKDGVRANAQTAYLMARLARSNWEDAKDLAKRWFQHMETDGLVKPVVAYGALIKGVFTQEKLSKKEQQIQAKLDTREGLDEAELSHDEKRLRLRTRILSRMVHRWLDDMRYVGLKPNTIICGTVVAGTAYTTDMEAAVRWMHYFRDELGVTPDAASFTSLMTGYGHVRDWDGMYRVLEMMKEWGVEAAPSVYNALIASLGRERKWAEALQLFHRMGTERLTTAPDVESFNAIINVHRLGSDLNSAMQRFAEMKQAGVRPDLLTFNTLIACCAKRVGATSMATADELYTQLIEVGLKPDTHTFNSLMQVYTKARKVDRVLKWYQLMEEAGVQPDQVTMGTVLNALSRSADPQAAVAWFKNMEEHGHKPNAVMYTTMISNFIRRGDRRSAQEWLSRMEAEMPSKSTHIERAVALMVQGSHPAVAEAPSHEEAARGRRESSATGLRRGKPPALDDSVLM